MYKPIWKLKTTYAVYEGDPTPLVSEYITDKKPDLESMLKLHSIVGIEITEGTVVWDEQSTVKKVRGWIDV